MKTMAKLATIVLFGILAIVPLTINASIISNKRIWYFPGDPAWPEISITISLVTLAICLIAYFLTKLIRSISFLSNIVNILLIATISLSLLPIIVIVSRHFGDMANIRDKAIGANGEFSYYISSIDTNVLVSPLNNTKFRVDFGNGGVAHFNYTSMFCVYSD